MNNLIDLVKNHEHSVYVLAAIAHACDNDGILNANVKTYREIISIYLQDLIDIKSKTPQNTMSSIVNNLNGKMYFDVIEKQILSLKNTQNLSLLKQEVINKLNLKVSKKQKNNKVNNLKPAIISTNTYSHISHLEKNTQMLIILLEMNLSQL